MKKIKETRVNVFEQFIQKGNFCETKHWTLIFIA